MIALRRINPWWWIGAGLALTVAKLWLSRGQGVYALEAGHDDLLFLQLAQQLVQGNWLGAYDQLTLAKGPAYPLFIAGAFLLGIPLFVAQHLFYAGACALFTQALRPAIGQAWARLTIFALLLWNPMTFDAPAMGRVLRQHLYGPLALLLFAGLIALYLRRGEASRRQLPWALLLGTAAGFFYLTREEVLWVLPSMLLLTGACLLGAWRLSQAALRRTGGLLGCAFLTAILPVFLVSLQNQRAYGWFGTSEFRASAFQDAYGAMLRVQAGPELPFVPVTREARVAMTAASPAFATLQQQFDSGIALGWAGASEFLTRIPPEQEQIGGGWMVWALRDAAAQAGYHTDAAHALKFYRQLADELNQACDDGRLPAGPRRSGFIPPWRDVQTDPFWRTAREFGDFVISFRHFSAKPPPSSGSPESLNLFRDLTRERISPPEGELDVVGAARYILNLRKVEWLHATGRALRPILLWCFILAQTVSLIRLVELALRREWSYPFTVAFAAWGACAASVIMHAMIQVSAFPVRTISSFAPIYPLLLVFMVAAWWDAAGAWWPRLKKHPDTADPTPSSLPAPDIAPEARIRRTLPWLAGLAALLPFLIWHRQFGELFWFGDDLFLIDQMAAMGFWPWSGRVFAENFVPLFKLLWGGALLTFDGNYRAMLWLLWLTHALNTAILARVLQRACLPWFATLFTLILFALTPANLETLGWSVQWSAVLATAFLLLGLLWHQRFSGGIEGFSWKLHLPLALFAAASACSFSRGVLTGPVLALALLLPAWGQWRIRPWLARLPGALLCLLPAVAVALVISLNSSGNHRNLGGHWGEVLDFSLGYFLFNPGYALLGEYSLHPAALLLIAGLKLAVLFAGLWISRGPVRLLLLLLLAYDLGNALLIGVGRFHTGFLASLSSRYQYSSLIATLPFVGLLLSHALDRLGHSFGAKSQRWAVVVLSGLIVAACLRGWPAILAGFTGWRGTELRVLINAPATDDPTVRVPALEFMHVERAKALQRAYNLH
ncbi:MAG TPA: hypothetical protein PLF88_02455 [Opitutaceae bacterium]|nr:hypothetical protein [Opitutaceae bacterium]HRJ46247.1 hypothetical protein [Opitutaceae bacterium]